MNENTAAQRYAAPAAHVEDYAEDPRALQLAGRWGRLAAAMLDFALLWALLVLLSKLTPWQPFADRPDNARILTQVLSFVAFVALQGYTLVTRGQTLGKLLLGQRIVMVDGRRVPALRLLGLRYGVGYLVSLAPTLVLALYGVFDALLIFGSNRRCLHDWIAGTVVVKS